MGKIAFVTKPNNLEKFLKDEPYFERIDEDIIDFSLGKSYESASEITKQIMGNPLLHIKEK